MLDLLFKNIAIADGSGGGMFNGSVGVKDGKIVKVGQITDDAELVIAGGGDLVLAPGFIDTHSHNDMLRFIDPSMAPQLLQGITYDVGGNCGISAAPVSLEAENRDILRKYIGTVMPVDNHLDEWMEMDTFKKYLDAVKKANPKIHTGSFVGHGVVRIAVMGMENRAPKGEELERMKELVREAMQAGALGISSGLIYTPGVYSGIDEMAELCKVVSEFGGIYATHMRNESLNVIESVKEAIEVARRAGVKLLISHIKVAGDQSKTKHKEILRLLDEARASGMTVLADQYLYNYGSTMLNALFPPKHQAGGVEKLMERLNDPQVRGEVLNDLKNDRTFENFFGILGPQAVLLVSAPSTPQFNNKHFDVIAGEMGVDPGEAMAEVLLKNNGRALVAIRLSEESVIEELWAHPFTCGGSDGIGAGTGQLTHPRAYGAFVRVFETYVRERGIVSLEEAVRKCTSLPAGFLGLETKGLIKEGFDADLVVFDKNKIGTDSDFANPITEPKGIEYVFVDGRMVVKSGKIV